MRSTGLHFTAVIVVMMALLSGCASAGQRAAMEAAQPAMRKQPIASSMQVVVAPGPATPAATALLPAEELKAAIESSLIKSGLFQAAGPDGAPYRLDARVVDVSLPAFGASFTADVEIAWTFGRTSEPTTIVRRAIRTQHTVGAFEAFAGAARARMAVEGAVRRNIDEMLLLLAGQAH